MHIGCFGTEICINKSHPSEYSLKHMLWEHAQTQIHGECVAGNIQCATAKRVGCLSYAKYTYIYIYTHKYIHTHPNQETHTQPCIYGARTREFHGQIFPRHNFTANKCCGNVPNCRFIAKAIAGTFAIWVVKLPRPQQHDFEFWSPSWQHTNCSFYMKTLDFQKTRLEKNYEQTTIPSQNLLREPVEILKPVAGMQRYLCWPSNSCSWQ